MTAISCSRDARQGLMPEGQPQASPPPVAKDTAVISARSMPPLAQGRRRRRPLRIDCGSSSSAHPMLPGRPVTTNMPSVRPSVSLGPRPESRPAHGPAGRSPRTEPVPGAPRPQAPGRRTLRTPSETYRPGSGASPSPSPRAPQLPPPPPPPPALQSESRSAVRDPPRPRLASTAECPLSNSDPAPIGSLRQQRPPSPPRPARRSESPSPTDAYRAGQGPGRESDRDTGPGTQTGRRT